MSVHPTFKNLGTKRTHSPGTGFLSPKRNSPICRSDIGPSPSPLPPSSIPLSSDPSDRSSRNNTALDFVEYRATPMKRRSLIDSPTKEIGSFDSQVMHSPTWSQPRSFERWRLQDLLESQRAFGDGKAGLEAEAEGYEPGEVLGINGEESEESEELQRAAMTTSSVTEADSQDLIEWFLRVHPELKFVGKAPQSKSSNSSLRSNKSGPDSAKDNVNGDGSGSQINQVGTIVINDTPPPSQSSKKSNNVDPITNQPPIENMGLVSPVKTASSLTESDSQSGGSRRAQDSAESQGGVLESSLVFSQPRMDPLMAFLDIFEGASSVSQDSHSVIDISDD